jgi:hypothetical protein
MNLNKNLFKYAVISAIAASLVFGGLAMGQEQRQQQQQIERGARVVERGQPQPQPRRQIEQGRQPQLDKGKGLEQPPSKGIGPDDSAEVTLKSGQGLEIIASKDQLVRIRAEASATNRQGKLVTLAGEAISSLRQGVRYLPRFILPSGFKLVDLIAVTMINAGKDGKDGKGDGGLISYRIRGGDGDGPGDGGTAQANPPGFVHFKILKGKDDEGNPVEYEFKGEGATADEAACAATKAAAEAIESSQTTQTVLSYAGKSRAGKPNKEGKLPGANKTDKGQTCVAVYYGENKLGEVYIPGSPSSKDIKKAAQALGKAYPQATQTRVSKVP